MAHLLEGNHLPFANISTQSHNFAKYCNQFSMHVFSIFTGEHPLIALESESKRNLEYWENRYRCNSIEWHMDEVHPHLLKYLSDLTQGKEKEDTPLKFFLPLCGKTKDIPFLLNLGFHVFGVEAVPAVIQEFSEENKMPLKYDSENLVYYNASRTLQIYCGDLFKCPIEFYGPFDCVWDRASFIALDYNFRPGYLEMMKRALRDEQTGGISKQFRYLLQSVKYDKTKFGGPPRCVDDEDVKTLFENWAEVKLLESFTVNEDHPCRQVARKAGYFGDEFSERFHLISPKNN